jgi:hypothetical protein
MALKFKEKPQQPEQRQPLAPTNSIKYEPAVINIPGLPYGIPDSTKLIHQGVNIVRQNVTPPPIEMPGANLHRVFDFYADCGGCAFYRVAAPGYLMTFNQKAIVTGMTTMVFDERLFYSVKACKLQRQATPQQLMFIKFLKHIGKFSGMKVIYEVDDIIFKDDIPLFNRCREAFDNQEIVDSILEMIQLSDEMTVTCEYMKDYYKEKTGNKNITVIPNYLPKFWFDRYYNEERLAKNYEKNKKKPKVGAFISGTHIDLINKTNQKDDYSHVVQQIIKTRKDIDWMFVGAFPLLLKPYIDLGEIKYQDWFPLMYFPQGMYDMGVQMTFAALEDNVFNRSKSNIKFLEAAAIGYPSVCQDMVTYKDALLKFKTGDELIDQIKLATKDVNTYMNFCKKSRNYVDLNGWLDDNLDQHLEAYTTPYGSKDRKALLKYNPEQANIK